MGKKRDLIAEAASDKADMEKIFRELEELHPGMTVSMAPADGILAEQSGIDAILELLNIERVAFLSDESRVGEFDTTDEELAAFPVPVTRDMTLLEALAEIRKVYPSWGKAN